MTILLVQSIIHLNPSVFLLYTGIRVQYDVNTSSPYVVDVQLRCAACTVPTYSKLDPDRIYSVLTSNFLIEGGDGYSMILPNLISRLPYGMTILGIPDYSNCNQSDK